MKTRVIIIGGVLGLILLSGLGLWFSTTTMYTWLMRKTVEGEVVSMANLTPQAVLGTRPVTPNGGITYSFAIAIKASDGTIYSASTEDRQWAIVKEGYRVQATLFPYGPLEWRKQGTYHGARLVRILKAIPSGSAPATASPALPETSTSPTSPSTPAAPPAPGTP
jgi:hypothetical protein